MSDRPDRLPAEGTAFAWGPYAGSAAAAGIAAGLHAGTGPGALAIAIVLPLIPALVVALAWCLGRPLFGIDRAEEVAYLAGCLAALTGWTAATGTGTWPLAALLTIAVVTTVTGWGVYGPGHRVPALALAAGIGAGALAGAALNPFADARIARWIAAWLVGTSLAAMPYWLHRRNRRATVPAIDITPLVAAIAKHMHAEVTPVTGSLNVGEHGRYATRLRLTNGKTAADVAAITVRVESELGLREGAVLVQGYRARRDEVTVTVVPVEPRAIDQERPALPASITGPAFLGVHDNGDPMMLTLYGSEGARSVVGGGRTGSGKTRVVWTGMKSWTATDDTILIAADFSGGASSEPWKPCLGIRITDPKDMKPLTDALIREANARAGTLPDRGWETWRPSPTDPAIVLWVDEAQRALKDWETQVAVGDLMQIARKSGISVILTQPNPVLSEGISPTIREQAPIRLCLASAEQAVKWVLGDTPAAPVSGVVGEFTHPGQILGHAPDLAAIPGRAADTNLADAKATAKAHAARRPSLDRLLTRELREFGKPSDENGPTPMPTNPIGPRPQLDPTTVIDHGTGIRDRLLTMTTAETILGQPWPEHETVPDRPAGRLPTEQALQVAAAMIRQPDGATPADIMAATGRKKTWVHEVLSQWEAEGVVEKPDYGRYRSVTASAGAGA